MSENEKRRLAESVGHRVAAQMQLQAEEKWIIESMRKIRTQLNSLQIERLQLESLKAKMTMTGNGNTSPRPEYAMQQAAAPNPAQIEVTLTPMSSRQLIEFETRPIDEIVCNTEELDLDVCAANLGESFMDYSEAPYEEYDDEDDESLDDNDIEIDMNMFMNACNPNNARGGESLVDGSNAPYDDEYDDNESLNDDDDDDDESLYDDMEFDMNTYNPNARGG